MTTTLDHPGTTPRAPTPTASAAVEPGTRLRRRAAGLSMIGAGAISLAGFLATPWEGGSSTSAYLRSLVEHPTQAIIAATLLHFGYLLIVPTAFVLSRLARRGAPRLAAVGVTLSVLGAGLSGLLINDMYDLSIGLNVGVTDGVPVSEMSGVDAAPLGFIAMGLTTSVGAIVGLILLSVAVWRARLAPLWPAVALTVGFAGAFGAHGMLRACGFFAVFAVGVAFLGVRVLRMSDERFAAGSDPR